MMPADGYRRLFFLEVLMKLCFVEQQGFDRIGYVFSEGRKERIEAMADVLSCVINRGNLERFRRDLRDVEVIVATWHMETLSKEEIKEYFPKLRLVLYAAGSVRYFAVPFLELGITVSSAASAMAVPVAEMTLSLIIQCAKGFQLAERLYRQKGFEQSHEYITHTYPGLYDGTPIGILGVGAIGRNVVRLLKPFAVSIRAYDPFLSDGDAARLGVAKTSLEEVFSDCQVVSNHLANNEQTKGMLDYRLFSRMKETAAFINTGRGAQVVECDLARAMLEKPFRLAVLDVTADEPYPDDGVLRSCPNVTILPHIAGFAGSEVHALSDIVIAELGRYLRGEPLADAVSLEKLAIMA